MPHPALSRLDHRPWPLPAGRWTWRQSWRDLLFAHWPVPASLLRPLVPPSLEIQEFDGTSWIGVVPFRMAGVMLRPLPDLPYVSAFPELNLRLYVERDGRPGVWFLSLDAANLLAVWAARRFFHLPYVHARIALSRSASGFDYDSRRLEGSVPVHFRARYRPTSEPYESQPGSLEHWLTERYCLYAQANDGTLYRAEVHHHPWPLHAAEAEIELGGLLAPHGLGSALAPSAPTSSAPAPDPPISGEPALLHFSRRIDVVVWSPEPILGPVPGEPRWTAPHTDS